MLLRKGLFRIDTFLHHTIIKIIITFMDGFQSTFKSKDTEEWIDTVWTRPIGYRWALLFKKYNVHPITVTILSVVIGVMSAFFFMHGSYRTEGTSGLIYNIVGVLLLAWANFYDSADGQLARMTGKTSLLGRILDGAAEDVWFFFLYCAVVVRYFLYHDLEFRWMGIADTERNILIVFGVLFVVGWINGICCHGWHCRLADYYRQIHLFFLKGKDGSEFDNSEQQQEKYDSLPWKGHRVEKFFLGIYARYTRGQEKETPVFQMLMTKLKERYGDTANIPQEFRDEFRSRSLPLMKYTNILTFNVRAIALYTFYLLDFPWMFMVFEMTVMTSVYIYMKARHEAFCKELLAKL